MTFTGHAPTLGVEVFDFAAETFTIYYQAGSAGFTSPTWMGYPATMIGGYANWTYFLNYWGTSPSERDCAVLIRRMPLESGAKKVIYREADLGGLP